jgi:tRNA G18 (ribose-2'-O)-methylase SpoU
MVDKNIYIPMNENCESLNVGVSASIILYELNK